VIDPENVAAQRLADRLEEVWAYRGESLPDAAAAEVAEVAEVPEAAASPDLVEPVASTGSTSAPRNTAPTARRERSALDRLLRRNRP
jgi:hypothetical protein